MDRDPCLKNLPLYRFLMVTQWPTRLSGTQRSADHGTTILSLKNKRTCGAGVGGAHRKGGSGWITGLKGQGKAVALYLVGHGERLAGFQQGSEGISSRFGENVRALGGWIRDGGC